MQFEKEKYRFEIEKINKQLINDIRSLNRLHTFNVQIEEIITLRFIQIKQNTVKKGYYDKNC